jgi:hypothetical protein
MSSAARKAGTNCDYRSCNVVGPIPKLECYTPYCRKLLHSYCYDLGVRRRNLQEHFDSSNPEPPFALVACTKKCLKKAKAHYANMTADPEDRNIPWNRDSRLGDDDPNNSENILISWLRKPGNYQKFRAPPNGKTKAFVCKIISRKMLEAKTLKVRKGPAVHMKIQAMEGAFRVAHDWVNNTGVGVLERDGQVTFEEAVKKRFPYYYDLVDVMSERASARPKASTDQLTVSSSSSDSDSDEEEENMGSTGGDDDDDSGNVMGNDDASKKDREQEDDEGEEDEDDLEEEVLEIPRPSTPTPPTGSPDGDASTVIVAIDATPSGKTSEPDFVVQRAKEATIKRSDNDSKANKPAKKKKKGEKSEKRPARPVRIDAAEEKNQKWKIDLLDVRREEMKLEETKWKVQERQAEMKCKGDERHQSLQARHQDLQYNFELMIKYKELQKGGFDNHQILELIPDMRPIIDKSNMPVHLQLSEGDKSE